jgi:hypothetical protein
MRDGRFLLIDVGGGAAQAAATSWWDRLVPVKAQGALVGSATALLIRPDGYLAWSGAHADAAEVRAVLAQWCGDPR